MSRNEKRGASSKTRSASSGLAQLTLVEHSLCPLDRVAALRPHQTHCSSYFFTDATGARRRASATVSCPKGLSPSDEFTLWGLLALTFSQAEPSAQFFATPHYCLRQLDRIDARQRRGGKNYRLFRESLSRLAAVTYQNDGFFDPVRGEHCDVSFGFLSYRLPLSDHESPGRSSRVWRINWDPVFFEFCAAVRGSLAFDLPLYRSLDPASRRLFLLLQKVFWRRPQSPWFDVRHLTVDVLGFSSGLEQSDLNRKLRKVAGKLADHGLVTPRANSQKDDWIHRKSSGRFVVRFQRGEYFCAGRSRSLRNSRVDSPLRDPLHAIGLDDGAIRRVLAEFPRALVVEWADITLAAIERRHPFRRSPQAYFIDNIRNARDSGRTPPDWWHDIRREEKRREDDDVWKSLRSRLGEQSRRKPEVPTKSAPIRAADLLP